MLKHIAAFEVRYQLRSPLFIVSITVFFLLAFGAVASDQIQIGGKGIYNVNAPTAIMQTLAIMSLFAIFIATAFVANVVIRDDDTGFAPILRATRITKFDYLVGRFSGALLMAILVQSAVPLAMLLGSLMPWLDAQMVGPTVLWHYVYAIVVLGVPTMFAMGAGFFALATVTRSMMWTYVGLIGFLVLFVVSRILMGDPSYDEIGAVLDPFAFTTLRQVTKYWTVADHNTMMPPLQGVFLYNRLLWTGVGAAFFALAYALFRFEVKVKSGTKVQKGTAGAALVNGVERDRAPVAKALAQPSDNNRARRLQFWALTRFDMAFVFKNPAFFVLLAFGMFNAFGSLFPVVDMGGEIHLPVTRAVVDALTGSFTLIPVIMAIFYSGELVWRDRDRRMHEIMDATAAPNWAFLVPKVMAITLVLLATYMVAAIFGVGFQLFHGFTQIDLQAMALWFILPNLIVAVLLAILSIFVQTLAPQKALGWGVMLLYVVASMALGMLGFEHKLVNFAETAPVPLSDMNAMGHFWIGRAWHQAYWLAFGGMLMVATHLMWRRGTETRLKPRFALLGRRLRGTPGVLLGLSTVAWLGLGGWVYYNTNILNPYTTAPKNEQLAVDYEKTLLQFENLPQPTVQHVKLKVDLYPKSIRADAQGSYLLKNLTGQPLSRVDVQLDINLKVQNLELDGATLQKEYPQFGHRTYTLSPPMQPGEQRMLKFTTRLEQVGFVNSNPLTRIVGNGTFLDNFSLTPSLGVTRDAALKDRTKRRKHGLPADVRPPKLEDAAANAHHYLRHDSDWVTADITLSTEADQTPLAPGNTVSDTTANGRRTLVTRTEAPIHNFYSLQSARYAVGKDTWVAKDGKPVALSVYYHPDHGTNVQRMLTAMKASLGVFSEAFSPYQFTRARVLEFPAYAAFAQSFANTVPYSESLGFIQNFNDADKDEKIDVVTYITAHEIAHQWWAHQVIGADKQGMTLLSESFAQYSALLVMEKLYGKEQIRKFLKTELDRYLRSRGSEVVEELPLNRVENQGYIHYQKGALAMYWLKEVVGEPAVNAALKKLLAEFAFKSAPYPSSTDFLRLLRAEVGPQYEQLIVDLFEKITLYDLKATDAKATLRPDGRYDVTFSVDAKKLYADGKGKETESPLNEAFDIGIFTAEPGKKGYTRESVVLMQRVVLQTGVQKLTFTVDKAPAFVGVDPYNMRIDRNSDDNLSTVELP